MLKHREQSPAITPTLAKICASTGSIQLRFRFFLNSSAMQEQAVGFSRNFSRQLGRTCPHFRGRRSHIQLKSALLWRSKPPCASICPNFELECPLGGPNQPLVSGRMPPMRPSSAQFSSSDALLRVPLAQMRRRIRFRGKGWPQHEAQPHLRLEITLVMGLERGIGPNFGINMGLDSI